MRQKRLFNLNAGALVDTLYARMDSLLTVSPVQMRVADNAAEEPIISKVEDHVPGSQAAFAKMPIDLLALDKLPVTVPTLGW